MLRDHFLEAFDPFPGDETFVICRLCSNSVTFEQMNIYDISHHVKSSHNDLWLEWIKYGKITNPKNGKTDSPSCSMADIESVSGTTDKDEETTSESEEKIEHGEKVTNEFAAVDVMIVKFFSKAGISLDMVHDRSFTQLLHALNKKYTPLAPFELAKVRKKISWNSRSKLKSYRKDDPLTLTIDIYKNKTEIYIAFSIHYFDENFSRINNVFMQKLRATEIRADEIIQDIKFTIQKLGCQVSNFFNIVTTNSFNEKSFSKNGNIPNCFICYYSYISNFVEQVIRMETVVNATASMRNFISMVRGNRDIYEAMETYFKKKRLNFFLPEIKSGKWILTTNFIRRCVKMHPHLYNCVEAHGWNNYVSEECIGQLKTVNEILEIAADSVTQLSKENATISMIIPEVLYMERLLSRDLLDNGLVADIFAHFNRTLQPILRRYRGGCYEFATFLDPRYCLSENIFVNPKWNEIETALLEDMFEKNFDNKFITKSEQFAKMISQEVDLYKRLVVENRPLLSHHPFEWWNLYAPSLKYLSIKARQLLSIPSCAVDADQYFGQSGKYTSLNGQTDRDEFNRILKVSSLSEKFRGRGSPVDDDDKPEPITKAMSAKYLTPNASHINTLNAAAVKRIHEEMVVPDEPEMMETTGIDLDDMINKQFKREDICTFGEVEVKQEVFEKDFFQDDTSVLKDDLLDVKPEIGDQFEFAELKEEVIDFSNEPSTSSRNRESAPPTHRVTSTSMPIIVHWSESDDPGKYNRVEYPTVIRPNMPMNIRNKQLRNDSAVGMDARQMEAIGFGRTSLCLQNSHTSNNESSLTNKPIKAQLFSINPADNQSVTKAVIRQPLNNDGMKSAIARAQKVREEYGTQPSNDEQPPKKAVTTVKGRPRNMTKTKETNGECEKKTSTDKKPPKKTAVKTNPMSDGNKSSETKTKRVRERNRKYSNSDDKPPKKLQKLGRPIKASRSMVAS